MSEKQEDSLIKCYAEEITNAFYRPYVPCESLTPSKRSHMLHSTAFKCCE